MKIRLTLLLILVSYVSFAQTRFEYSQLLETYIETEQFDKILALETEVEVNTIEIDTVSANILSIYGETYLILGDYPASEKFYRSALNVRKQLTPKETIAYSDVLYNLITVYLEQGKYILAKEASKELLEVDAQLHGRSSPSYLESVVYASDVLIAMSEYDEALKLLNKQLKNTSGNFNRAAVSAKLGYVLSTLGNYEKSTETLSESSTVFADLSDTLNFEITQNALGLNYLNQGKYPVAEQIFLQAKSNLSTIDGTEFYLDDINNNLALSQMALGRSKEAISIYQELVISDSLNYGVVHPKFITSLLNLGTAYHDINQYSSAERVFKRALELVPEVYGQNSEVEASLLNNLANVQKDNDQIEESIKNFGKAAELFERLEGKKALYATVIFNTAKVELLKGSNAAEKLLLEALKIREKQLGKSHPKFAEVTNYLGIYYWQQNDLKKAREYFEETFINFFQQIKEFFPALSEEEKTKFYQEKVKPVFEQYNSLAEIIMESDPSILGTLYDYQLRTKGIIMVATERLRRNIYQSADSVLINNFTKWKGIKERLSKLYSNNDPRQSLIDSLKQQANSIERDLVRSSSAFAEIYDQEIPDWKQVQSKLKDDEVALEIIRYRVSDPKEAGQFEKTIHYLALIIDAESEYPRAVLLTRGNLMEGRYLNNYRNSIRYQIKDNFSYKELWKPLESRFNGIKKIYISPDGVYNQINLNTLVNPESGEFLIKEVEIQEVTSTRDLLTKSKSSSSSDNKVLLGFPTYTIQDVNSDKEKSTRSLRGALRGAESTFSETRGLRGGLLRYMRSGEGIATLPGTKTEIEEISKIYSMKSFETLGLLSEQANESRLKTVDNPEILHIATHGYFLENVESPDFGDTKSYYQNPLLRAGLILAGAEDFLVTGSNSIDNEDGILTAYEAMNMNLNNTDLVVLSACETGLGEISNGEGVYGLQRAFKIAGARYIVMSMWNVDDDATQRLMTLFYENLIQGEEKFYAFRNAQIKLMDEYQQPFYWGAFKIVGD